MKNITLILVGIYLVLGVVQDSNAARLHKEIYYQEKWCSDLGGITEYILPDRTRVDCLLPDRAVEVDFASKWYEALGQALYYAKETKRKASILLIMEKEKDYKYNKRLLETIAYYKLPVTVYTIKP